LQKKIKKTAGDGFVVMERLRNNEPSVEYPGDCADRPRIIQ